MTWNDSLAEYILIWNSQEYDKWKWKKQKKSILSMKDEQVFNLSVKVMPAFVWKPKK